MTSGNDITVIDEWTSVVDRTVAKAMSHCVQKFAKKQNKQIILLSCHHDIIEWVKPDWVIDCNKQEFQLPAGEDFFFQRREELRFDIREVGRETWRYFSKYHYLSDKLPGGRIHTFGLFHGENQIGFQCFANYVPVKKGVKDIYHSNRTVIHPDYAGLGMGITLINLTSNYMVKQYCFKIMAKFSSVPVFKAMIKQKDWKFLGEKRLMGSMRTGGSMDRQSGFREQGVKTFHFEYIGHKNIPPHPIELQWGAFLCKKISLLTSRYPASYIMLNAQNMTISQNQKKVQKNGTVYTRFLETMDFIYFAGPDEDQVLMFRRITLELVSNNYFGQCSLFEEMVGDKVIWASKTAQYCIQQMLNQL